MRPSLPRPNLTHARAMGRAACGAVWRRTITLPPSAIVVGLAAALVFVAAGLVSCHGARTQTRGTVLGDLFFGPEPDVRVRVVRAAERVTLDADEPLRFVPEGRPRPFTVRGPVTVEAEGLGLRVLTARDETFDLGLAPVAVESGGPVSVDGVKQHAPLRLHARTDTAQPGLDVVSTVPMEAYVAGVIARELYQHWHTSAFEVQAVAARSYAMHERERARRLGRAFDIESTTVHQVYGGVTGLAVATRAARATRGQVLTDGGGVLRAYYSSTCGGRAAAAADTWPTGRGFEYNLAGPIQAFPRPSACEPSPLHRWERRRTRGELTARLRAWGASAGHDLRRAGAIESIRPDGWADTGRPARYALVDREGRTFTISAESLRLAANARADGVPDVSSTTRLPSGDVDIVRDGDTFVFRGRGFGHGVGLCQFCASEMARAGDDWRRMAMRFYPGARVERRY